MQGYVSSDARNCKLPKGWTATRQREGVYLLRPPQRTRIGFWAALVIACLFGIAHCTSVQAAPKVEPFIMPLAHVSDALRGPPLFNPKNGCEPTTDFSGIGATLMWPRVELDVAHGFKWRDYWCGEPWRQPRESGTFLSLKVYPWRR